MGNDKQKNNKAADVLHAHAFIQDKRDLATRMYIRVAESKVYHAPEDLTVYENILPSACSRRKKTLQRIISKYLRLTR